jgi:UDP-glucuronate decarboxylase
VTIKNSKILITGGAGFIGSHIAERMLHESNEIVLYDNLRRNSLDYMDDLPPNIHMVKGDILDPSNLRLYVKDVDYVLHLASVAGISTVTKSPVSTMKINLIGTYNLLEALVVAAADLKRLLFASTSEVYGPRVYLGKEEDLTTQGPVSEPRWTYATSKLASEHLIQSYHSEFGIPTTIVRLFNVYGPRQTGESAIHNFVVAALRKKPLIIYGEGLQIRAWCYITDAVNGLLMAAENLTSNGRVLNIGNPRTAITIVALANMVKQAAQSPSDIIRKGVTMADVDLRVPDISLAQNLLGYEPEVSLPEGVSRTISWYKARVGGGSL